MTLKGLGASTAGGWAAALLQRAKGGIIALALAGILGVLASHLALALRWTDLFHYACYVMGSLGLYALALTIGHVGNARELPLPASDWQPAPARLQRLPRARRR